MPIRDGEDALKVNWFEITVASPSGGRRYHNAFATDLEVGRETVGELARCARARWKVENNAFGILKDSFNLEHNFGHGSDTLAGLLAMFNIISLLMQNACELRCEAWKAARAKLAARYRLLDHIRTVIDYAVFQDWSALLRTIATAELPEKPPRPAIASPQTKQSAVPLEIRPNKEKIENELIKRITAEEQEWATIPERDKTGRLRKVYWACRAKTKPSPKSLVRMQLNWRVDRSEIGRASNYSGDGFNFLVDLMPRVEDRFEWIEVTEVITTEPGWKIKGAMRAWNGIPDKHGVDFDEFRKGVPRGRPSRVEQRIAAGDMIAQIKRKLGKASYRELLEKYGYGTLVVGMPLWFAVTPDEPYRAENAIDEFMTRTVLGLEELKRQVLRRKDCPFSSVIVVWDTTPEALRAWREGRSVAYADAANASLDNPLGRRCPASSLTCWRMLYRREKSRRARHRR